MSHFYGTLQGSRGQATRCGTASSGVTVQAAGWGGAIQVHVWQDENGQDRYQVSLIPWQNSAGETVMIDSGLLDSSQ